MAGRTICFARGGNDGNASIACLVGTFPAVAKFLLRKSWYRNWWKLTCHLPPVAMVVCRPPSSPRRIPRCTRLPQPRQTGVCTQIIVSTLLWKECDAYWWDFSRSVHTSLAVIDEIYLCRILDVILGMRWPATILLLASVLATTNVQWQTAAECSCELQSVWNVWKNCTTIYFLLFQLRIPISSTILFATPPMKIRPKSIGIRWKHAR